MLSDNSQFGQRQQGALTRKGLSCLDLGPKSFERMEKVMREKALQTHQSYWDSKFNGNYLTLARTFKLIEQGSTATVVDGRVRQIHCGRV